MPTDKITERKIPHLLFSPFSPNSHPFRCRCMILPRERLNIEIEKEEIQVVNLILIADNKGLIS